MKETRLQKSLMNAKVNLLFYFIALFLSFFSRKVFLENLGADFLGLIGTLQNILGFLNLAELGISMAIGYVLYKPLFDEDKHKINEVVSVLGYLYRKIGLIIIVAGISLASFFPLIFRSADVSLPVVYFAFYAFLFSSLIGYFANYKQTLLAADQKNYVVTAYFQTSTLIKTILQIIIAYRTGNYYYWIAIEIVFGIAHSLILNWKIKQVYPWLSSNIKQGKQLLIKYPEVFRYIKQLFVHKTASFVQFQTAPLLIYAFVSLKTVTFYGNYTIIISKLAFMINSITDGLQASVGNLIAEGNEQKTRRVFKEILSFRYLVAGILVFGLYNLTEPFITLWLGAEYILEKNIFILILLNTYIGQTRGAVDSFINGFGLFADVWAPVTEAIISLSISIVAGYYWGLAGVLSGTLISMLLIICFWKPYYLYSKGFKVSVISYFLTVAKFILILAIAWFSASTLLDSVANYINPFHDFFSWTSYAFLSILFFSLIFFILMFGVEKGMKDFTYRMFHKLKLCKLYG